MVPLELDTLKSEEGRRGRGSKAQGGRAGNTVERSWFIFQKSA